MIFLPEPFFVEKVYSLKLFHCSLLFLQKIWVFRQQIRINWISFFFIFQNFRVCRFFFRFFDHVHHNNGKFCSFLFVKKSCFRWGFGWSRIFYCHFWLLTPWGPKLIPRGLRSTSRSKNWTPRGLKSNRRQNLFLDRYRDPKAKIRFTESKNLPKNKESSFNCLKLTPNG